MGPPCNTQYFSFMGKLLLIDARKKDVVLVHGRGAQNSLPKLRQMSFSKMEQCIFPQEKNCSFSERKRRWKKLLSPQVG